MTLPNISAADEYTDSQQTQASAVSRAAIKAGATGAAALPLILLMLGTGLRRPRPRHGHTDEIYFRDTAQCSINWF